MGLHEYLPHPVRPTAVGDVVEPLMEFVELGLLRVVPFFGRRHRAVLPEDAELGLPHDFGIARDEIIGAALRSFAAPLPAPPPPPPPPPTTTHNFWI